MAFLYVCEPYNGLITIGPSYEKIPSGCGFVLAFWPIEVVLLDFLDLQYLMAIIIVSVEYVSDILSDIINSGTFDYINATSGVIGDGVCLR